MDQLQKRVMEYIESNKQELIDLCSQLIKFNSENPPGDSKPINEYISNYLKDSGIDSDWHKASEHMYNLTSSIGNPKGKKLIFCGHTDVVPAGDLSKWDFDPFSGKVRDGWILGRGASDMKGGLAGIIFALVVLKRLKIKLNGELSLAIVPDEETGGDLGVPWLLERNLIIGDACVIAEASSPQNPTIGQKGSCWFRLTVKGESAHGSLGPIAGDNAITNMCKAIEKIKGVWDIEVNIPKEIIPLIEVSKKYMLENEREEYIDILEKVSVNIGTISGGTKSNVVPDTCVVEVDCRIPFGISNSEVINFVKEELDRLNINYEIEQFGLEGAANYTSPEENVCKAVINSIEEITKEQAYGVLQWASSDARHFRRYNIPVLQYGPAYLPSIHGFNEKVLVDDVVRCAKVYALTALKYLS